MPSQRKRIGFLPSKEVHEIIDKLCKTNDFSQSKVTGLLVEEALRSRGVLSNSFSPNDNDQKNFINEYFEKEKLSDNYEMSRIEAMFFELDQLDDRKWFDPNISSDSVKRSDISKSIFSSPDDRESSAAAADLSSIDNEWGRIIKHRLTRRCCFCEKDCLPICAIFCIIG